MNVGLICRVNVTNEGARKHNEQFALNACRSIRGPVGHCSPSEHGQIRLGLHKVCHPLGLVLVRGVESGRSRVVVPHVDSASRQLVILDQDTTASNRV